MAFLTLAQFRDLVRGHTNDLDLSNDPANTDSKIDALAAEAYIMLKAATDHRPFLLSPATTGMQAVTQTTAITSFPGVARVLDLYRATSTSSTDAIQENRLERVSLAELFALTKISNAPGVPVHYALFRRSGVAPQSWRVYLYPPASPTIHILTRALKMAVPPVSVGDSFDLAADEQYGLSLVVAARAARLAGLDDERVEHLWGLVPKHIALSLRHRAYAVQPHAPQERVV